MGLASRMLSSSLDELSRLVGCLHSRSEIAQNGQAGATTKSQVCPADAMRTCGRHHFLTREAGGGPAMPAEGGQRHHEIGGLGTMLYGYAPAWVLMAVAQPPV
jgi:hypothetical protein